MSKQITMSQLGRNAKRGLAVAMAALLLGVLAAPEPSLAAPIRPHPPTGAHVVHPEGTGDSPVVP